MSFQRNKYIISLFRLFNSPSSKCKTQKVDLTRVVMGIWVKVGSGIIWDCGVHRQRLRAIIISSQFYKLTCSDQYIQYIHIKSPKLISIERKCWSKFNPRSMPKPFYSIFFHFFLFFRIIFWIKMVMANITKHKSTLLCHLITSNPIITKTINARSLPSPFISKQTTPQK